MSQRPPSLEQFSGLQMSTDRRERSIEYRGGARDHIMRVTPVTITEYDNSAPASGETDTATFGLGCFWGPDAAFGAVDGVVRTRVGYAGGTTQSPTYHDIGDHSEVVQVDYLPSLCSYRELLDHAFNAHDQFRQPAKRQYHHLLLFETDHQREVLDDYLDSASFDQSDLATRIEPLGSFTVAEDYHQKYSLRSHRWATDAFEAAAYDSDGLRESPAAAIVNADLAGKQIEGEDPLASGGSWR